MHKINMLTPEYKYFGNKREILPLTIQIQLSKKPKTFCYKFVAFLESTLNFKIYFLKQSSEKRGYLNA